MYLNPTEINLSTCSKLSLHWSVSSKSTQISSCLMRKAGTNTETELFTYYYYVPVLQEDNNSLATVYYSLVGCVGEGDDSSVPGTCSGAGPGGSSAPAPGHPTNFYLCTRGFLFLVKQRGAAATTDLTSWRNNNEKLFQECSIILEAIYSTWKKEMFN